MYHVSGNILSVDIEITKINNRLIKDVNVNMGKGNPRLSHVFATPPERKSLDSRI